MTDVIMPFMGESIAEGTISVWLVDVGAYVEADKPLVTVSTDKADVDIPSPASGVLKEVLAEAGITVKVGAIIARIDETAVKVHPPPAPPIEGGEEKLRPPEMEVKKEGPALPLMPKEGMPAAMEVLPKEPEKLMQAPPEIEVKKEAPAAPPEEAVDRSALYSPAVMRLAAEHGVDLKAIKGTGLGGRVTKADVMKAVEAKEGVTPPSPRGRGEGGEGEAPAPPLVSEEGFGTYRVPVYEVEPDDTEMPFSRLRRLIADHMVYSKRTSPHVTTITEVDFDKIVGIRENNKARIKQEVGISLTFMPFVMLAAIRALKEFPLMNSVVQGDRIITKRHIHLGVAVDTERGLMVPVIKSAEEMGLIELAKAVNELSVKVRDRKVTPEELTGGTFTVTNPGRKGNLFGTPIISQPQVGILRMGEVTKRPVVVEVDGEDAIAIRPMMFLALSYDHRVVDGFTANGFLHRVKEHLEEGDFPL